MSNRKRKKIVLLIVEGGSDEALLMERLKEKFTKNQIQFRPYNGDILFDKNNRNKLIKNVIGNFVTDYQKRNKLMKSDILTVLHLIDTDGVFIENDAVQICPEQTKKTFYETERICVDSEQQKKEIERRNKIRAKNIYTMRTCTTIVYFAIEKCREMQLKMQRFATHLIPFRQCVGQSIALAMKRDDMGVMN